METFALQPGRKLGPGYEVVELLGTGWEGEVYRVVELRTGIHRAAKMFFPHWEDARKALIKYAKRLDRLADCCGDWLYHDFYNTVADCDPLYAAWHDMALPLEWKRNAYEFAYRGSCYETGPVSDTMRKAKMLATFFGCGRIQPGIRYIEPSIGRPAQIALPGSPV